MGRQHGSNHWIKVQKHTPDKPELRHVSRACGVSLGDAFLAWFRVYAYFDESTEDGSLAFFTAADADDIGKLPGLGHALASVGWLLFDDRGCTVVHWDRHNGNGAKARALHAEGQNRYRSRNGDGLVTVAPSPQNHGRDVSVTRPYPQTRPYQTRGVSHDE